MKTSSKHLISKQLSVILMLVYFLSIQLSVFPQNRGGQSFAMPQPTNLKVPTPMKLGAKSPKMLGGGGGGAGVGGVSFDQIALPVQNWDINSLSIGYDTLALDGNRFLLDINGTSIKTKIYDWMLIPTAHYSNSPYYSCFTYFGKLEDKVLEQTVLDNGGHILNYHPNLYNTLLGLRVGDMDLLMMYDFVAVPTKKDGEFILGAGENTPDTIANALGLNNFLAHVNQVTGELQQNFRSYVITDYLQEIVFKKVNDTLSFTGNPFYFCWRYNMDNPDYDQSEVESEVINVYQAALDEELKYDPLFNERQLYTDSLLSAALRYEERYSFYESGTFVDLVNLEKSGNVRLDFLEQFATSSLYNMLISVEVNIIAYEIEYLETYSTSISRPDLLAKANPEVWNATKNLMHYAAFFRYVKHFYPIEWNAFMDEIQDIIVEPEVYTPTVMYPTGAATISSALNTYFSENALWVSTDENLFLGACNTNVQLSASGSGIELEWEWTPNDGSLSDVHIQNPVIVNPNLGLTKYIVSVKDAYGNFADDSIDVKFDNAPYLSLPKSIAIGQTDLPYTIPAEAAGTELEILWSPNDGSLNSVYEKNPQIIKANSQTTNYVMTIADKYGCKSSDTVTVDIELNSSGFDQLMDAEYTVLPNPFTDQLIFSNAALINRIEIMDASGRTVLEHRNRQNRFTIDTQHLIPGSYAIVIYLSNQKTIVKNVFKAAR